MNIVNLSTEFGDIGITGGLAKATYSLTVELKKKGHDIQVIVPCYEKTKHIRRVNNIPVHQIQLKREIAEHISCGYGPSITKFRTVIEYFHLVSSVNPDRSALEAMLEFNQLAHQKIIELTNQGWVTDLVILNDWQTGMCAPLLSKIRTLRTLLIIHNATYTGFDHYYLRDADGGNWLKKFVNFFLLPSTPLFEDSRSALEQAIAQVNDVITVSPSYAAALLNPKGHAYTDTRITNALKKKGVEGILNVLGQDRADTTGYNNLVTFNASNAAEGKAINKQSLQAKFNLPLNKDAFLVTMMARLVKQKGITEVIDAAKLLFQGTARLPIQLLLVGSTDDQTRTSLRSLMKHSSLTSNIIFIDRFVEGEDRELILRGTDAMLMPSIFEPCGMIVMESSQYGTIPIYTPIEGFHDSVIPFDGKEHGYGIQVKYPPTGRAVFDAITAAQSLFVTPTTWNLLITNAMTQHWGWDFKYDKYFT